MINRVLSWSIRAHMVVLLFLLALPCMILIVRSGMGERSRAMEEAKRERLRFVDSAANEEQSVVAGAQQLATALALIPEVHSRDVEATGILFSDLLKANPQFSNISVADKSGIVWASAAPFEGPVSVADRRSFREAVRTGTFSSGEYSVGRLVRKPVINFGYPVKNKSGELAAVVSIALDVNRIERMFERIGVTPGASFTLLDHRGILYISSPKNALSEKLIGQRDMREELFTRMNDGPDEGSFEAVGNDGKPRLFAYKRLRLPHESKPYLYIRSSVPLALVSSRANAAMLRNLALLALVCGVGVAIVWLVGKRLIVNPVLRLRKASEQLSAGADTVNVSRVVKAGELGQLARAFDDMAEALAQRETDLRKSEERYRLLVETANEGIWSMDGDHVTMYVNRAMADMIGYSPSQMIGRKVEDFFFPEDMPFHEARMKKRHSGEDEVYERRFRKRDGSPLWTLVSANALHDGQGGFAGSFAMFIDITDRKKAEEELRENKAQLDLALQAARMGSWYWDIVEDKRYFDDQVCRILGIDPSTFRGSPGEFFQAVHPDDRETIRQALSRTIEQDAPYEVEYRSVWPDGSVHYISARARMVRGHEGKGLRLNGLIWDVTPRRLAEEALRASLKEKEVLLKEIHHRVKNNLQVMSSLLNLQSQHLSDPKAIDIFKESMSRVKTMALIHDKLYRSENLSRIYFPGYVSDLCRNLVGAYAMGRDIDLNLHIDPVSFDIDTAIPLGLIINELVSNALKHGLRETAGGAVSIYLHIQGARAILTVSDNGVGFPENLDFRNTSSMGMQLIITLVEQLEGSIELTRGKGAEFTIAFQAGE